MKIKKFLSAIVAGALAFSTLASMSTFSSSADEVFCGLEEDEDTFIYMIGGIKDVKYQTRTAENGGTEIRFVAEVMDKAVEDANYAQWSIEAATADAPNDFVEVETQPKTTKAYKSLIASGKKVTAPEDYSYIISKKVASFNNSDVVQGKLTLLVDAYYYGYRTATIGAAPSPSSSQAEESSESGLVIGDDEDSSEEGWGGNQNGGNGDASSVVNDSSSKTDSDIPLIPALKDCKITCHTTPGEYGGADIFFVAEVKEDDYLSSIGYEWYIEAAPADDPENFVEVETQPVKAPTWSSETFSLELQCEYEYEADGITHKAPSGYVYLISDPVGSFNTGDHVYGEIFLLNFANACGKEVTIDCDTSVSNPDAYAIKMPEESSEVVEESSEIVEESSEVVEESSEIVDESSVVVDESSEDEEDSSIVIDENADIIWQGRAEINKWKGADIDVTNILQADKDGVLTFYAKPIDANKSAQVQIGAWHGEDNDWDALEDESGNAGFEVVKGKVHIRLTEENAELLRDANGLTLNGNNVVITMLTYIAPEKINHNQVLWEGNEDLTSWTQDLLIDSNVPFVDSGDTITIYATAIGDCPQIQLSGNDIDWEWFDITDTETGEAFDLTGDSVTITLDDETANLIAHANSIFVKGCDVNVTKVVCGNPVEPVID